MLITEDCLSYLLFMVKFLEFCGMQHPPTSYSSLPVNQGFTSLFSPDVILLKFHKHQNYDSGKYDLIKTVLDGL